MTKFKQFERYPTRNGGTALILRVFSDGSVDSAIFMPGNDYRGITRQFPNGRLYDATTNQWDILPPEPEKRTVWVNVYQCGDGKPLFASREYKSRGEAGMMHDSRPGVTRVGCHRITLRAEFESEEDAP